MSQTIKQPFGTESGNDTNVGTVGSSTYCSVKEYGDGVFHMTRIALADLPLVSPTSAANKAGGAKIYTLPAGAVVVSATHMEVSCKSTVGSFLCQADTPDLGVGTTVATGTVAVLGGTAAFENMLTGQTVADCNQTAKKATLGTQLVVLAADSHDVFLNIADGWAGADTITATGHVLIQWTLFSNVL